MSSQFDISQEFSADEQEQLQSGFQKLQQMSQIQENIFELTDICWEKCFTKSKQNDKQDQICMMNCAERFLDATSVIVKSLPAFEKLDKE
jgi:import inner membrane translocase subunit TIM8